MSITSSKLWSYFVIWVVLFLIFVGLFELAYIESPIRNGFLLATGLTGILALYVIYQVDPEVQELDEHRQEESTNQSVLMNGDLNCTPQGNSVTEESVSKIDSYLDSGEKVHFIAKNAAHRIKKNGIKIGDVGATRTAATDKRIVVKMSKGLFGSESLSVRYNQVTAVDLHHGLSGTSINIDTPSQSYGIGIGQISKKEARDMADFIRQKIMEEEQSVSLNQGIDPLEKIEKLQELKQSGAITDEEFTEKKKDLLEDV